MESAKESKWIGPIENENYAADRERSKQYFGDRSARYAAVPWPDGVDLPWRVPKRTWKLETTEGFLRVDFVRDERDDQQWWYRAVFEDGDGLDWYRTLEEAMTALEGVASAET